MTLFDLPDADPMYGPAEPPKSYGRRLTERNARLIADGIHPITRLPVIHDGHTCGDCACHVIQGGVAGRFHKCELHNTGGPATDLRVSWPACTRWTPELEEANP